jgi:asparagine synthase (glutamine-hydrolysing)
VYCDSKRRFALGHVRLSVLDTSAESNQPFWSACGRYVIVFNGEIYNYLELREEIRKQGVVCRTSSDTEVLLQLLVVHGTAAIDRLNGMWAFVFVDTATGEVIVSRDRWGVKPLYCSHVGDTLMFCSEAKGLFQFQHAVPPPNENTIGLFLRFGMGGELTQSWFQGVIRFPQAHWARYRCGSAVVEQQRYWDYPVARCIDSRSQALDQLETVLTDAVKIRLRSDVPCGLTLSGGVDSAMIAWVASSKCGSRMRAFTSWFPPREESELPRAERVAALFGHTLESYRQDNYERSISDLRTCIYHLDSGHASPAVVPYLNLCRAARRSLTVLLEGQGADELFGGYHQFACFAGLDQLHRGDVRNALKTIRTAVHADGVSRTVLDLLRFTLRFLYINQANHWGASKLLSSACLNADPQGLRTLRLGSSRNLDDALRFWHQYNLTNLLQYGDAVSMSVALETRCPFLDRRLVELGFSIQSRFFMEDGCTKTILRRLASKAVPHEVVWRRRKDGFTNPTLRMVYASVRQDGWTPRGLQIALDQGILKAPIRDQRMIEGLTENAVFRIHALLTWLEVFYSNPTPVAPVAV